MNGLPIIVFHLCRLRYKIMIDKHYFFDSVKLRIFGEHITQSQVDGLTFILDQNGGNGDLRWLAYMLATTYHETAYTMQPISEFGNSQYFTKYDKGKLAKALGNIIYGDGERYKGRGFVQITGRFNYEKFGKILNVDLINTPELALLPEYAFDIMVIGMTNGIFTGKKFSDYFNAKQDDWLNARRIINGIDKATYIADKGHKFFDALRLTK